MSDTEDEKMVVTPDSEDAGTVEFDNSGISESDKGSEADNVRRKNTLSIESKIKILEEVDKKVRSRSDICKEFNMPKSTLQTIIRNRDKIQTAAYFGFEPNRKRLRQGNFKCLEKPLLEWALELKAAQVPMSAAMMAEKAQDLANQMGLNFSARTKANWLDRFRSRYGMKSSQPSEGDEETFISSGSFSFDPDQDFEFENGDSPSPQNLQVFFGYPSSSSDGNFDNRHSRATSAFRHRHMSFLNGPSASNSALRIKNDPLGLSLPYSSQRDNFSVPSRSVFPTNPPSPNHQSVLEDHTKDISLSQPSVHQLTMHGGEGDGQVPPSLGEVRQSLTTLRRFVGAWRSESEVQRCHVQALNVLEDLIDDLSEKSSRQTRITEFFKK